VLLIKFKLYVYITWHRVYLRPKESETGCKAVFVRFIRYIASTAPIAPPDWLSQPRRVYLEQNQESILRPSKLSHSKKGPKRIIYKDVEGGSKNSQIQ
jgi:hypothetical protein